MTSCGFGFRLFRSGPQVLGLVKLLPFFFGEFL